MSTHQYRPVFSAVHDVAIFGAGLAGFAAARTLVAAGKSVIIIDRGGDAVAEHGRSFQNDVGEIGASPFATWMAELAGHEAASGSVVDGASTEIYANSWIREARNEGQLSVLYYAQALAVEIDETLNAVLLGTKSGLHRLAARQWIDATNTGELALLIAKETGEDWTGPEPATRQLNIFFRAESWEGFDDAWTAELAPGTKLSVLPSLWPEERCLHITAEGPVAFPRSLWLPSLRLFRDAFPTALSSAILTHGSVEPFDTFPSNPGPALPKNVLLATPWGSAGETPAGRYEWGHQQASALAGLPAANPSVEDEFEGNLHWTQVSVPVAVAGLGTGGAFATLAAARAGGAVMGFDPLPFCGGIGAGGGIHVYYFGVKGGLQEEVDERIRAVMPLFGARGSVQGFHPDAKKCVLEEMLLEAGASLLYGATILDVETEGDRVVAALLATPQGPVRLAAEAWIDSTGDGDLAARAGAQVNFGRDGDGLLHAYSQSAGQVFLREKGRVLVGINYDAGYVDATDSEDMTRARLDGIEHYYQPKLDYLERVTYIAPAIGLRQSRHIECDYMLTWADHMERRRFPDSVGLTGSHYDNHAMDLEFESDEALFWAGVCRGFRILAGTEIPYRCLLPKELANVWMACRALGVTQDAHHSMRMQRDMQRVGEIAGIAAVIAPSGAAREVDFANLRAQLASTGAMDDATLPQDGFGSSLTDEVISDEPGPSHEKWLDTLINGEPGADFWHLYWNGRTNDEVRDAVLALLDDANQQTAYRAAAIAAMWDEPAAEAPLLRQVAMRHEEQLSEKESKNPRAVHNWFLAISLLRRVGTARALPLLAEVASEQPLLHNVRTAIALSLEAIAGREALTEEERQLILSILETLIRTESPNSVAPPQHGPLTASYGEQSDGPIARRIVREDLTWQIHLTVARARHVLGLPLHAEAQVYLTDDRALVRRGFNILAVGQELATEGVRVPVG